MKENFEIESLLMPVPIGIATMVDLIVMASTLSDFSLEAHTPRGGFQFVKHPESFHASLQQVSFAANQAFLKAHINMDKILRLAKRMSDSSESIKTIFESGEEEAIVHLVPKDLASIKEAVAQCSQLSKMVVDGFNQVMELTEEVNLVTTALKGGKGRLNAEADENLNILKLKKEESEKMLMELEETKIKIEAEAANAYIQASEAMDAMPGTAKTVLLHVADKLLGIFRESDLVEKVHYTATSNLKAAQVSNKYTVCIILFFSVKSQRPL